MTENNQSEKLDDATKVFKEAKKNFMVNNSKEEKINMEKKSKNDEKSNKVNPINLSIAIGVAVLLCFVAVLFFLH